VSRLRWAVLLLCVLSMPGAADIHMHGGGGGYTDEQAQDAVGTICTDTATIDCTYNDAVPSLSAIVIDDSITYAKMQNVSATSRSLCRKTAGAGDTEECTLSELLDFVGSAAQGDVLYRGAATWTRLGAGTSGHFLQTQGAGANPQWAAGLSGGATDKLAIWASASSLTHDTLLHWNGTTDVLGVFGPTAGGASGVGVLVMGGPGSAGSTVPPTTAVTDAAQLYVRDYAATKAAFAMKTEDNIDYVFGESLLFGTTTVSSSMIRGIYIEQAGHDNGGLQLGSNLDIAHGMTALGPTSMYGDFRKIIGASGGLQMRGITEDTLGVFVSAIVTNETATKSASADAAVIVEVGRKDSTTVQGMSADSNLFAVQDRFAASPTKFLVDNDGDTWQPGNSSPAGLLVQQVATQTIAAGNTVTANQCGAVKRISSAGAVTTSTSATFTAPAASNVNCVMHVVNVGANDITLDANTDFITIGGADVVLTANDAVIVGSTGAAGKWYQMAPLAAN
jgi:hypothetical protein